MPIAAGILIVHIGTPDKERPASEGEPYNDSLLQIF